MAQIKDLSTFLNGVYKSVTGEQGNISEDLHDIVDVGKTFDSLEKLHSWYNSLIDAVGKRVFVDRVYEGNFLNVLRDSVEYGSARLEYDLEFPEYTTNKTFSHGNGSTTDLTKTNYLKADIKMWNIIEPFQCDVTVPDRQLKMSFQSAAEMAAFISMIYDRVNTKMTIALENLVRRAINNMIALTLRSEYADDLHYSEKSGIKAVNLLYLYNQSINGQDISGTITGTETTGAEQTTINHIISGLIGNKQLTEDNCLTDPNFIRFATFVIGCYQDRLKSPTELFNIGKKLRWTPAERLNLILLSEFKRASDVFLQSGVFNKELVALPNAQSTAFWQSPGLTFNYADTSEIHVVSSDNQEVAIEGIIGVMFDTNAVMVVNEHQRTTSFYNPDFEATNYYFKSDMGLLNKPTEQFVVFFAQ